MDTLGWISTLADALSLLTFAAAVTAWWQIRKITSKYQAIIRLADHVVTLNTAASEIVRAAPSATGNPDAVLDACSTAEGKLTSVKGWIGSRYSLDSRRRELVSEITEVQDVLKRHQARGAPMDKDIAMDTYRRVVKVTERVGDYLQDRRLEHR